MFWVFCFPFFFPINAWSFTSCLCLFFILSSACTCFVIHSRVFPSLFVSLSVFVLTSVLFLSASPVLIFPFLSCPLSSSSSVASGLFSVFVLVTCAFVCLWVHFSVTVSDTFGLFWLPCNGGSLVRHKTLLTSFRHVVRLIYSKIFLWVDITTFSHNNLSNLHMLTFWRKTSKKQITLDPWSHKGCKSWSLGWKSWVEAIKLPSASDFCCFLYWRGFLRSDKLQPAPTRLLYLTYWESERADSWANLTLLTKDHVIRYRTELVQGLFWHWFPSVAACFDDDSWVCGSFFSLMCV